MSGHSTPTDNRGDSEDLLQTVAEPLHQLLQRQREERSTFVEQPVPSHPSVRREPEPFRPWDRQPLALLTILDDGRVDQGEKIRVRTSSLILGRSSGDVRIPFDPDMSAEHAELRCRIQEGRFQWYLLDKKSRNGTFVRAYRASLYRDTDLILGGRLYRFMLRRHENEDNDQNSEALQTRAYQVPSARHDACLTELGQRASVRTYSVTGPEARLGSDPSCDIVIESDRYLSGEHVRFYQDATKRWMLEDLKSRNGVWVRVRRLRVDNTVDFQLGQQRFRFEPRIG